MGRERSRRIGFFEKLENREMFSGLPIQEICQGPFFDINFDNIIDSSDVVAIINDLNEISARNGTIRLDPLSNRGHIVDPYPDGLRTPIDALVIINDINENGSRVIEYVCKAQVSVKSNYQATREVAPNQEIVLASFDLESITETTFLVGVNIAGNNGFSEFKLLVNQSLVDFNNQGVIFSFGEIPLLKEKPLNLKLVAKVPDVPQEYILPKVSFNVDTFIGSWVDVVYNGNYDGKVDVVDFDNRQNPLLTTKTETLTRMSDYDMGEIYFGTNVFERFYIRIDFNGPNILRLKTENPFSMQGSAYSFYLIDSFGKKIYHNGLYFSNNLNNNCYAIYTFSDSELRQPGESLKMIGMINMDNNALIESSFKVSLFNVNYATVQISGWRKIDTSRWPNY